MSQPSISFESATRGANLIKTCYERAPEDLAAIASEYNQTACADLQEFLIAMCDGDAISDDEYCDLIEGYDIDELSFCAAELLAHCNATEAIPIIVRLFHQLHDLSSGDLVCASGPELVASFKAEGALSFFLHAIKPDCNEDVASVIAEGVKLLGDKYPEVREALRPLMIEGLSNTKLHSVMVTTQLMSMAVEWRMTEAAEAIERAFSENRIDCGIAGDWEMIRDELQVDGLGLPMPKRPIDSLRDVRAKFGIGTFSSARLFSIDGELEDQDAVDQYIENACQAFIESDEAKRLRGHDGDFFPFDVDSFLRLGLDYEGAHVENMTPSEAQEILLNHYPRKISMDASQCDEVVQTLEAFWKFCDRCYGLEHAARIAKRIKKLRQRFRQAMSNPDNFGIAKSLVMQGMNAGYDMHSQEGMEEYMQVHSQALAARSRDSSSAQGDRPQAAKEPSTKTLKQRKKLLAKIQKKKKR